MYDAVIEGLMEAANTVPEIKVVLDYEPNTLQDAPALYFLLHSFDRATAGQVTAMVYNIIGRLCIRWQDNEEAEKELMALLHVVCNAIEKDMTLGGRIASGLAYVDGGDAAYRDIGEIIYRTVDFRIHVTDKADSMSGI